MKFAALLTELRRRNVLHAAALYIGSVWVSDRAGIHPQRRLTDNRR